VLEKAFRQWLREQRAKGKESPGGFRENNPSSAERLRRKDTLCFLQEQWQIPRRALNKRSSFEML